MLFEPGMGILLHKEKNTPCQMEVRENSEFRWMIGSDGIVHGSMDLNDPINPITPYIQCMLCALVMQPKANSVLNLGLGCGSLERYIHHAYPWIEITSVELFQERIDQTNVYFPLPKGIEVVAGDAFQFVNNSSATFDLIFHDTFVSLDDVGPLYPENLFYSYHQRLNPQGVFSMNCIPAGSDELLALLIELRKHFPTTALLEVHKHSNIIIFGLKGDKPPDSYLNSWGVREQTRESNSIKTIFSGIKWLP
jgi:spermidine synthase